MDYERIVTNVGLFCFGCMVGNILIYVANRMRRKA